MPLGRSRQHGNPLIGTLPEPFQQPTPGPLIASCSPPAGTLSRFPRRLSPGGHTGSAHQPARKIYRCRALTH
jgi:hypothetical protein